MARKSKKFNFVTGSTAEEQNQQLADILRLGGTLNTNIVYEIERKPGHWLITYDE